MYWTREAVAENGFGRLKRGGGYQDGWLLTREGVCQNHGGCHLREWPVTCSGYVKGKKIRCSSTTGKHGTLVIVVIQNEVTCQVNISVPFFSWKCLSGEELWAVRASEQSYQINQPNFGNWIGHPQYHDIKPSWAYEVDERWVLSSDQIWWPYYGIKEHSL